MKIYTILIIIFISFSCNNRKEKGSKYLSIEKPKYFQIEDDTTYLLKVSGNIKPGFKNIYLNSSKAKFNFDQKEWRNFVFRGLGCQKYILNDQLSNTFALNNKIIKSIGLTFINDSLEIIQIESIKDTKDYFYLDNVDLDRMTKLDGLKTFENIKDIPKFKNTADGIDPNDFNFYELIKHTYGKPNELAFGKMQLSLSSKNNLNPLNAFDVYPIFVRNQNTGSTHNLKFDHSSSGVIFPKDVNEVTQIFDKQFYAAKWNDQITILTYVLKVEYGKLYKLYDDNLTSEKGIVQYTEILYLTNSSIDSKLETLVENLKAYNSREEENVKDSKNEFLNKERQKL